MDKFTSAAPLLPEIFALHGKWRSQKEAVICGEQRLNWQQFCDSNHRFANALIAAGIATGDRVAVVMSNGLPMVQALFGSLAAGAASVPINLSVNDDALIGMLVDAGVSALIVSEDQRPRMDQLLEVMPSSLQLFITAGEATDNWQSMEAFCQQQSVQAPARMIPDDTPLNIIYSSGTTGLPKGILHTQRGRRDWAYDLAITLRYHAASRTLITIGLYSNISWVAMLSTLLAGGTLVIHSRFDVRDVIATTAREAITHTAMVPIQFQRVIEVLKTEGGDVSSMQAMMSCGSPLHESLKRDIFDYFNCGIIELYGLTEGIITTLQPEDAEGRWSSVGTPLIGTDIAIVDEDDHVLGPNQSGEVVSRGRISMPGYWQREEANKEAEFIDPQGVQWLRSGDIGYVDEQGYLFIVDRKKDMILSGGQNIYPQDIEAVLIDSPVVDDVAVIGLPSKKWGETPVALVVAKPQFSQTAEELLLWANERLGKQQRLSDVIYIQELPRNPNGKILKRELRKVFGVQEYG